MRKEEQEVHINFGRDDKFATAYITNPVWIRKLDRCVEINPNDYSVIKEHTVKVEIIGKTYKFPKKYIKVQAKPRVMSEEQRQAARERFQKMWQDKKNKD